MVKNKDESEWCGICGYPWDKCEFPREHKSALDREILFPKDKIEEEFSNKEVVEISYDKPNDKDWLCPENIEVALSHYCKNTKFKVRRIKLT